MYKKDKSPNTVAIATLGCKVNQFESASFLSGFAEHGLEEVPFSNAADIYVINTCAVTAKAGSQSRQLIRRALRANPNARFIVTGCYAQAESEKIREMTDAPLYIIGNADKDQLVSTAVAESKNGSIMDLESSLHEIATKKEICDLPVKKFSGRTRAFLKVQDGCNNFCSYCIVPYTRGRSRSLSLEKCIVQAQVLAEQGYRELVLTGIHIGAYGHDLSPRTDLFHLLFELAKHTPDIRYRISSLEPTEITDEILQLIADTENIMPHLHIPLQSGDDNILKKMNRLYTALDSAAIVKKAKKILPEAAIGVDVLVGFPGEDDEAFSNTISLLEKLPITYLHVFPYSKRPGTRAADFPDQLANKIKEERVACLRELDHKKRTKFYSSQIGKVHRMLIEIGNRKSSFLKGFTDNYVPVIIKASIEDANKVLDVELQRLDDNKVLGRIVK